jgi:hypothetical protein
MTTSVILLAVWSPASARKLSEGLELSLMLEEAPAENVSFLLQEPVYELYECLIGLKAEALQKGLNWVVEHAHISLPTLPNELLRAC